MLRPHLDRVGRFNVEQIGGIPHFPAPFDRAAPPAGGLHTTEGSTIEGALSVFKQHYAPQFLVGHDHLGKMRVLQLVQVGTIGAALEHHNDLARVQVEVAGFSRQVPWRFDDETCEAVAALMAACKSEYGIPLSHPWPDGDFGLAGPNKHRSSGRFGHIPGWFGHGDIPDNSHWDPGALQWGRLFALAEKMPQSIALPTPTPPVPPRPCACHPAPAAPAATPA